MSGHLNGVSSDGSMWHLAAVTSLLWFIGFGRFRFREEVF